MNNPDNHLQQLFEEGSRSLQSGDAAKALACFRSAAKLCPSNATLHLYTGAALHALGRFEDAVASYRLALDITTGTGEVHNNLGNSLLALGRFAEAADSFSSASRLLPSSPVPLTALATTLQALGNVAEAEAICRSALSVDSGFAAAHWNLALNLLLQGKYIEGWQEYEWRWKKSDFTSPLRHTDVPLWDGSPLEGRTILLHAEQGFGDAIQFVRYAPLVAQLGGKVVVECHPQLVRLFQGIEGVMAAVAFGELLPPYSCQAPLLSLPRIFQTTLQTIPSQYPYLHVPIAVSGKFSELTFCEKDALRVGLVWAGKDYPDPLRSCQLEDLAPLASMKSVCFYSLQLGRGSEQSSFPPSGMQLTDLADHLHDFADTAALIEQLDLVISIDTAVAHLAGALGKKVFLMLPFAPDWRWLLKRSDSLWYPTMQIFRQKNPGDWQEVTARVHTALDGVIKNPSRQAPKD